MRRFILRIGVCIWHGFICFSVLVVLLALLWAAFYGLSVHRRVRAERLIRHFTALNFAHPDEPSFQQLKNEIGAAPKCTGDVCSYEFAEGFGISSSGPFRLLRRTEWDYVGVRPWQLKLEFKTQDGRVSDATYSVMVGRGRGWLYNQGPLSGSMWSWLAGWVRGSADSFDSLLKIEKERLHREGSAGSTGIIVQKTNLTIEGGGEALSATFAPDAPLQSRRIAFDVNLRCATSMVACTELCQLFPSAWQSYAQFQKSQGWYVEEPGVCPPLHPSADMP